MSNVDCQLSVVAQRAQNVQSVPLQSAKRPGAACAACAVEALVFAGGELRLERVVIAGLFRTPTRISGDYRIGGPSVTALRFTDCDPCPMHGRMSRTMPVARTAGWRRLAPTRCLLSATYDHHWRETSVKRQVLPCGAARGRCSVARARFGARCTRRRTDRTGGRLATRRV